MTYTLLRQFQSLETVSQKNLKLSLLASGNGTELIHHTLERGSDWALAPEEGWEGLESLYMLKGILKMQSASGEDVLLTPGDSLSFHPVKEHTLFTAETHVEFLYVTSLPVFHLYSLDLRELMEMAVKIEEKDGYTADHCTRIRRLSNRIGREMKLPMEQIHSLAYGAFFHDLGKIKIPEFILLKPARLTNDEWETMKLHTIYGAEMLRKSGIDYVNKAADIVEQHHERFDGSGYPMGLKGDNILIQAHIVGVADSFDAMTTDRPYHQRRSVEEAIEEIKRHRGTLYHPEVVDAFLTITHDLVGEEVNEDETN